MFFIKFCRSIFIICLAIICPARDVSAGSSGQNVTSDVHSEDLPEDLDCSPLYNLTDVVYHGNGDIFIQSENRTYDSSSSVVVNNTLYICDVLIVSRILETCENISYKRNEYTQFRNGSVLLYGDLLEPGAYEFDGDDLITCWWLNDSNIYDYYFSEEDMTIIYMEKITISISIIALSAHLIIFCSAPNLRNLPGYNLASLSVSFLFGYSFLLLGQRPEVVGVSCVITAVLQQYFFLTAFFCMNVMAFDVWNTLRLATKNFKVCPTNFKLKKFLWYSLYAWGASLVITIVAVVLDNIDGKFNSIKLEIGKEGICWIENLTARIVFFIAPAFILFIINCIFFVGSSLMIQNNKMKGKDQENQTVRINHLLYIKLGVMMGITWLIAVIAAVSDNDVIWFICILFNSLQGLCLFILFACSRKVINFVRTKTSFVLLSTRQSTISSKLESN